MAGTEYLRTNSDHAVHLVQTLYKFSKQQRFTDFIIRAADTKAYCHSPVLCAQSSYIDGLCAAGVTEAKITLHQPESQTKQALEQTVRYLYLGTIELTKNIVESVLQAAQKIDHESLRSTCEGYYLSELNIENCPKFIEVADKYHLGDLSRACVNLKREKFSHLIHEPWFLPSLTVNDLLRYLQDEQLGVFSEDDALEAVSKWIVQCKANEKSKEQHVDLLMPHVRLSHCDRKKLEEAVSSKSTPAPLKVKIYDFLYKKDVRSSEQPRGGMEESTIMVGGRVEGNFGQRSIKHLNRQRKIVPFPDTFENGDSSLYSVCASDSSLYVSGGYDTSQKKSISAVYQFNFLCGEWIELTSLPRARDRHASVVNENRLYIIGGVYRGGQKEIKTWHRVVHVLNLTDLTWSTVMDLPYGVKNPGATVVDEEIYVMGGWLTEGGYSRKAVKYQPSKNQWTDLKEMPAIATHCTSSTSPVGKRIYVLARDKFLLYDTDKDQWSTLEAPPIASYWCSMTHLDGTLLAMGGYEKSGHPEHPHNRLQKYDLQSQKWSLLEDTMPVALSTHWSFVVRVPCWSS